MTVNVRSEKNLGMWGSILALLGGFVPYIGSVLALVGSILVLVALHGIGNAVGDDRPFKNYLFAFIVGIAVLVLFIFVIFATFGLTMSGLSVHEEFSGPITAAPSESMSITNEYTEALPLMIISGVFLLVVLITVVNAYFEMKAWSAMYEITRTKSFEDAANWFKWGAITAIVLVGFLLIFIARIFVILGFSNMPDELEEKPQLPLDSHIA
ncbi:hypothetical protein A3L08_06160 [Thermococcus pacificus]|uniref:DUF996 domain-containing protein n=1 Tax=Thermococcus pacificus TaxID=71998 RepID=A0A218P839_9EURY|nr:hypothetical protein A3L08_06160 [Thermococcus pacificus]